MNSKDFFQALDDLEKQRGIDKQVFIKALENALTFACKKHYGEANNIEVKLNPEKTTIRVFAYKNVVSEVLDSDKEISLEDARLVKKSIKLGETIANEVFPKEFGRIAAQTAKQVIMQTLREMERSMTFNEYIEKENELLVGVVTRLKDDGTAFVEVGKNQLEGILLPQDQIPNEVYAVGQRIKVYVKKVKDTTKGAQIVLSRASVGFVKRLFETEVPEIRSEIIVIKAIAREAGYRTKIAVFSNDNSIDAVGSCVGNRGLRVNAIVEELNGEKIDIVNYSDDILDFIARSLSPARVLMVLADEDTREAKVIVEDSKLSLAIGKDGQNARLAARITGWKIDVKSYSMAVELGIFDAEDTPIEEMINNAPPIEELTD